MFALILGSLLFATFIVCLLFFVFVLPAGSLSRASNWFLWTKLANVGLDGMGLWGSSLA